MKIKNNRFVSQSQYAKMEGVSRQAISDRIKRGTLALHENGKVDLWSMDSQNVYSDPEPSKNKKKTIWEKYVVLPTPIIEQSPEQENKADRTAKTKLKGRKI